MKHERTKRVKRIERNNVYVNVNVNVNVSSVVDVAIMSVAISRVLILVFSQSKARSLCSLTFP